MRRLSVFAWCIALIVSLGFGIGIGATVIGHISEHEARVMQAKLDRAILERDEARTELKQNKAMVIAWSGLASFYADAHHGKLTASGSRFDMNAFTAANRTLRFGSLVLVLDTRHFTWVLVEIADRGPAKWTERDIDLSRAAARQLGMEKDGIVPVVIMMIQGRVSDRD